MYFEQVKWENVCNKRLTILKANCALVLQYDSEFITRTNVQRNCKLSQDSCHFNWCSKLTPASGDCICAQCYSNCLLSLKIWLMMSCLIDCTITLGADVGILCFSGGIVFCAVLLPSAIYNTSLLSPFNGCP